MHHFCSALKTLTIALYVTLLAVFTFGAIGTLQQ
jgi:hypothetical protein